MRSPATTFSSTVSARAVNPSRPGTPHTPMLYRHESIIRRKQMADLAGSKTHENLKEAFAGESQANRRYLYFARRADIEGDSETAGLFRDTAEGETGHAFGHMDFLAAVGDPATDEPVGNSEKNLISAVAGETFEFTAMYPGFAKTAREEGFDDIADWFATLARAEKTHAGRFQKALDRVRSEASPSP